MNKEEVNYNLSNFDKKTNNKSSDEEVFNQNIDSVQSVDNNDLYEYDDEDINISNYELLNKKYKIKPPKIVVFGVGGGGCNAVNNMYNDNIANEYIDFVMANTDLNALNFSNIPDTNKILLGRKTTGGYGAGCNPEIGEKAAEESSDEIKGFLKEANMIFITSCMGGGTGTGASSVIARIAKEMDILVAAIVTKPFEREGSKKMQLANDGIRKLKQYTDTLIIIPNQNLCKIANPKTRMIQSFESVDKILKSGVKSIVDLLGNTGFINLDFSDLKTIMKKMGKAMMGTGEGSGQDRAKKAVEEALNNPLLDNISIKGAKGVIINITSSVDLTLYEYNEITGTVNKEIGDTKDTMLLHGNVFDPNMTDKVRVSIFATGIDSDLEEDKEETFIENLADNKKNEKIDEIINNDINKKKDSISDIKYIESKIDIYKKNDENIDDIEYDEKEYVINNNEESYLTKYGVGDNTDNNDFFDIGETKTIDDIGNSNVIMSNNDLKTSYQGKIVENYKSNLLTENKTDEFKNNKYVVKEEFKKTEKKKNFFFGLFGNKKPDSDGKEYKKIQKEINEIKQNKNENLNLKDNVKNTKSNISIEEIENFDDIDINIYEIPAYIREKK